MVAPPSFATLESRLKGIDYEEEIERSSDATLEGLVTLGFKLLRRHRFLAAQSVACCMSCSMAKLGPRTDDGKYVGCVYNHRQDTARNRRGEGPWEDSRDPSLALRYFGHESGKADGMLESVDVGRAAAIIFRGLGFVVDWNEDPNTVLFLKPPRVPVVEGI